MIPPAFTPAFFRYEDDAMADVAMMGEKSYPNLAIVPVRHT